MNKTFLAIGLCASAALAAPALAAENEPPSAAVEYSDLDLETEEGQRELAMRIDRAADAICESQLQRTGTRAKNRAYRKCHGDVREQLETRLAQITADQHRGG